MLNNMPLCGYITFPLSIHPSTDGHFRLLATVSNATMGLGVRASVQVSAFISFLSASAHDSPFSISIAVLTLLLLREETNAPNLYWAAQCTWHSSKFFMFYLLIHCLLYFTAETLLLFGRGQSDNDSQAIDWLIKLLLRSCSWLTPQPRAVWLPPHHHLMESALAKVTRNHHTARFSGRFWSFFICHWYI